MPRQSAWHRQPIVDLCETHVDCVNRTAPVVVGPTPYKMLRTTNVKNGYIDTKEVRYVDEPTYRKWTRRLVPRRGDVVLTREAPLGEAGKVRDDEHLFLGQRLYHFRPDPKRLDSDFLLYALMSSDLQGQIRALGSGSTVEHMRLADIPTLEINAPDVIEQRRIASILSAYDDLIENCQRRIRILEDMARGLYREWFVHFRFPGADAVPRVDSPLGPIPQGWEIQKLSKLARYVNRGIAPSYDEAGPTFVINQKCIRDQRLSLDPARRQNKTIPSDKQVRFGDVLINSTGVGTLGRVAQVLATLAHCTVDTHVTIARPGEGVDPHFFGMSLLSLQADFERLGVGATGQTELSRTAICELQLPVPSQDHQQSFGRAVGPMRELSVALAQKITNLRRTRDLLLPRLLSGQIALPSVEAAAPA